ncbi:hypothetical protein JG687_00010264 [Phytophthora cactorum]|uniref:P-loop containing nucleoside triphosphate hydrolase n=1 Tax=Phytophthora cactorum TaxID=29920 RepID=A0A8T1U7A3_9STRA|nr:hypothetical protein JG687_00010264 [Phytophthora cactorum]
MPVMFTRKHPSLSGFGMISNGTLVTVVGFWPPSSEVKLSKLPNLSQATIMVKQFPIVPAFACTTEKLQGKMCHQGVVVSCLTQSGGVSSQTIYVALSRTTTLAKLTLTEPLTTDYIAKFDPDPAAATEMQRLIALICEPPYTPLKQHVRSHQWRSHQNVRQH